MRFEWSRRFFGELNWKMKATTTCQPNSFYWRSSQQPSRSWDRRQWRRPVIESERLKGEDSAGVTESASSCLHQATTTTTTQQQISRRTWRIQTAALISRHSLLSHSLLALNHNFYLDTLFTLLAATNTVCLVVTRVMCAECSVVGPSVISSRVYPFSLGLVFGFLQKVSIFNGEARSDDVGGTESMLPLTARLPATAHLTSETKSSPPSQCYVCTKKNYTRCHALFQLRLEHKNSGGGGGGGI